MSETKCLKCGALSGHYPECPIGGGMVSEGVRASAFQPIAGEIRQALPGWLREAYLNAPLVNQMIKLANMQRMSTEQMLFELCHALLSENQLLKNDVVSLHKASSNPRVPHLEASNRELREALKAVCEYESVSIHEVFTSRQKARALLSRLEKEGE